MLVGRHPLVKILLQTNRLGAGVGGAETVALLLVLGLRELGHEIKVVTETDGGAIAAAGVGIYRQPSAFAYLSLVRWCDVLVPSEIELGQVWPLLVHRRPWTLLFASAQDDGEAATPGFATKLALGKAAEENAPPASSLFGSPYADDIFRLQAGVSRDHDFIVAGRLVPEKGVQVAIEALHRLHQRGYVQTRLTVAGEGPYLSELVALVEKLGLQNAVEFTGNKSPEELARLFNRHRILIVPTLVPSAFGLTALEGMACGCFVVASDQGKLKEIVGPGGVAFAAGDVEALAKILQIHLDRPEVKETYLKAAPAQVARYSRASLLPAYVDYLEKAMGQRQARP